MLGGILQSNVKLKVNNSRSSIQVLLQILLRNFVMLIKFLFSLLPGIIFLINFRCSIT